ncbi:GntR family transcriptional regulator [Paenibacillus eucommiae]|uniref:DNA-binding GntR family transcriptional regulator n=1 Tax=Paenibacillus eucommiae TaxID=1355755 RepID=A0ABS4INJ3_9BACL|nr:GntR family transcriptional regulator [Paenibacillus eucommiae]MBP1989133.1 DNA-binding GntR family transcriptional regulator [Paenibacillus eucommiae]
MQKQSKLGKGLNRDYVYDIVKQNILTLKFEPGIMISEKDIAEKLEVSRTPTREAFIKLAEEGLIVIYPQKGSFVSLIDMDQVEEARFVRETMEVAILKIACDIFTENDLIDLEVLISQQKIYSEHKNYEKLHELDEEFHRTIFIKCGKNRIWVLIQQMLSHYKRFRNLLLAVYFDWEIIIQQHTWIVQYIREHNFELAEKELRVHVKSRFEKDALLQKYPNFFLQQRG